MMEKQIIPYYEEYLDTDREYTIDELKVWCDSRFNYAVENMALAHPHLKVGKAEVTHYTVKADIDRGYYGDSTAEFKVHIYRTETDKEASDRINKTKANQEAARVRSEAAKAREFTKKLEREKLEKDPEYKKFLELQKKFK